MSDKIQESTVEGTLKAFETIVKHFTPSGYTRNDDVVREAIVNNVDEEYSRLLIDVLNKGRWKNNRTGIKTIGVFGEQAKFKVDLNSFPILTTKKVWFKGILHELIWFIKGDTNIKYLVDNDVHIWDEWAYKRYTTKGVDLPIGELFNKAGKEPCEGDDHYRLYTQQEFIQRIKECPIPFKGSQFTQNNWEEAEFAVKWGELGEGTYGGMWRSFPYYDAEDYDGGPGHVDQLKKVIDKLKTNPDDRRMIVSAWHPHWVDHCALPPCHCLFHFHTEELTHEERCYLWGAGEHGFGDVKSEDLDKWGCPKRKLNLLLYQRSCDSFLGVPFNITSYSLLLALVAHCVGMEPGTFTHTYGDLHIYENHIKQVNEQLGREPKKLPKLWLNPNKKDLFTFEFDDVKLIDYDPHPAIKGEVAV